MTPSPPGPLPSSQSTDPSRRRRGAELVRAIHTAAVAEVLETGLAGMTMEGIARRARAAKTSLYRRWSSPAEILLDALHLTFPTEIPSADADDLRGDLVRALEQLSAWMRTPMARAAHSILTAGPEHAELRGTLYEKVFDPRGRRVTLTILNQYAEQGAIEQSRVTGTVADIGEAMVMKILLDAARLPTRAELEAIVDEAILPAVGADRR